MLLHPRRLAAWVFLLLLQLAPSLTAFNAALAQAPPPVGGDASIEGDLIDRVVAIVGDSAVFNSQVQEEMLRLRASGAPMPEDSTELRDLERTVLDGIVDQMLVLNAALEDSLLTVPDGVLDEQAEGAWQEAIGRFGSEAGLSQSLGEVGLTLPEYRANLREEIRRSLLIERYIQTQRSDARAVPIEEAQIREFFEREEENLGDRPESLTFSQVVLAAKPSESVRAVSREEAEGILARLDDGGDFADFAQRFSDDPGSAPRGGELGWVRLGTMVAEFEEAAFSLDRGDMSEVVETQFGAHIILVERIRGPERMLRHILIGTVPTPADVEAAAERAREIRDAVVGGVPISEFLDEGEETGLPNPMTVTRDQVGRLPAGIAQELGSAEEGAVLGPIEVQPLPGQPAYAIVELQEIREAGQLTYEDVRDEIRGILQGEQFQNQLMERLRSQTYVEVRW